MATLHRESYQTLSLISKSTGHLLRTRKMLAYFHNISVFLVIHSFMLLLEWRSYDSAQT